MVTPKIFIFFVEIFYVFVENILNPCGIIKPCRVSCKRTSILTKNKYLVGRIPAGFYNISLPHEFLLYYKYIIYNKYKISMDNLLLNLKILANLPQKGRLGFGKNGILSLENDNIYNGIKRYMLGISRKDAIIEIENLVNNVVDKVDDMVNSKWMLELYNGNEIYKQKMLDLDLIKQHLIISLNGINNLKHTYNNDLGTISKIDMIVDRIETTINKINLHIHRTNNDC